MPESDSEQLPAHGLEDDIEVDDTVRVEYENGVIVADVDAIGRQSDGPVGSLMVTLTEAGAISPTIWDLRVEYHPDDGWGTPEVAKRIYGDPETEWDALGDVDDVRPVDQGIDRDRLDPGVTVEMSDGHHYRVVVPPWEREWDDKALAYNLDGSSNVCEKIAPEEVIRRVQ